MACLCRRQPKAHGHILVVNAPHGAPTAKVFNALANQMPVKVLTSEANLMTGETKLLTNEANLLTNGESAPLLKGSLDLTNALVQSAVQLAQQGQVPVLSFEDPSHCHIAQAADALSDALGIPITSLLMYSPLEQIVKANAGSITDLMAALQDFAHMYHGSFEPSPATLDVLTRTDLEKLFVDLKASANDDDQASLALLQRFLASTLGLNLAQEVHLEPRANTYDAVMHLMGDHKAVAKDIVAKLRGAVAGLHMSALHHVANVPKSRIPSCPTCQRHIPKEMMNIPNGRIRSSLPVCGSCLNLMRKQLLANTPVPAPAQAAPSFLQLLVQAAPERKALMGTDCAVALDGKWHDMLRYNEVFQKSSKNSNARSESLMDQLVYHRIRSLELDLHTYKGSFLWSQQAPARDWWMTHGSLSGLYESHQFDRLSQVLQQLQTFHTLFPNHEVITLFLNVNDNFGKVPQKGHQPEDLDALLERYLGELLVTPKQLKGSAPSLQAAVKNGWPALSELVGKFIPVVITGAQQYADAQDIAENMKCFVAKSNISHPEQVHRHNWVVFFDLSSSNDLLAKEIDKAGFVSRQWVESQYAYQQAIRKRAHHLATKSINYHHNTWSKTHTTRGFPFLPFSNGYRGFDSSEAEEPINVLSLRASTGQLWGMQDNAVFASFEDQTADGQWVEYQWLASNANSHMNKWARAGVAFRASKDDEGAAYFALVRPAQYSKPPQVQMRPHSDGITTSSVARSAAAVLLKIRCRYNRGSTDCEGYFSEDGQKWRLIRSTTIPARLSYHGLIASSSGEAKNMDSSQYRFLFANLTRDGDGLQKTHFPYLSELGMVYRTAHLADGFGDDMLDMDMDIDYDDRYGKEW